MRRNLLASTEILPQSSTASLCIVTNHRVLGPPLHFACEKDVSFCLFSTCGFTSLHHRIMPVSVWNHLPPLPSHPWWHIKTLPTRSILSVISPPPSYLPGLPSQSPPHDIRPCWHLSRFFSPFRVSFVGAGATVCINCVPHQTNTMLPHSIYSVCIFLMTGFMKTWTNPFLSAAFALLFG